MSVRWYVACWTCERRAFVDKAAQIYDERGAEIWIDHPPSSLDVAQLVLFMKAHNGHRVGLYPDNDDPILGEMLEWAAEEHVPGALFRKARDKAEVGDEPA